MRARADLVRSKVFPQGFLDVLRQIVLFGAAYYAYRFMRGVVDDGQGAALAFQNARELISIEETFGFFSERNIQEWTGGWGLTTDFASLIYINAQTTVVLGSVFYLYLFHNQRYYFVRNMMVVAMVIALLGYILYPTAPPRFFFAEYGFRDTVSEFTGVSHRDVKVNALFNPYAAVPSMHCCFAMIIGGSLASLAKHRVTRILWLAYPVLMCWVVVVTGNHWILDAVLGGATAGISLVAARWLAKQRPEAWSFHPAPEPVTVQA
jgi:membrane-associated phospholipid phosphatase